MDNKKKLWIKDLHEALVSAELSYPGDLRREIALAAGIRQLKDHLHQIVFATVIYGEPIVSTEGPQPTYDDSKETAKKTAVPKPPKEKVVTPTPKPAKKGRGWKIPEEELARVAGKMSDLAASRELNCSATSVYNYRRKHNIPSFGERIGISESDKKYIGRMPDRQAAELIGVTQSAVAKYRLRHKIPSYGKTVWTTKTIGMLGCMPDSDVATKLDIEVRHVESMRIKQGIKPYDINLEILEANKDILPSFSPEELAFMIEVPAGLVTEHAKRLATKPTIDDKLKGGKK